MNPFTQLWSPSIKPCNQPFIHSLTIPPTNVPIHPRPSVFTFPSTPSIIHPFSSISLSIHTSMSIHHPTLPFPFPYYCTNPVHSSIHPSIHPPINSFPLLPLCSEMSVPVLDLCENIVDGTRGACKESNEVLWRKLLSLSLSLDDANLGMTWVYLYSATHHIIS